MIDLRKEFDEIMHDFGYPVLLQRTNRKLRCRCWNELYSEADSRCPICHGTGWVISIERHVVRSQDASLIVSKPNMSEITRLGNVYSPARAFFFRYDVHPKVGDVIYEVGWQGKRPVNLHNAYEINHVQPERGDRGRIEFYMASVKLNNLDRDFKDIVIRRVGSKTYYDFVN